MERMADTEKDALKAAKDAEKAAKKAKQDRIKASKPKKEGTVLSRTGKSVKKFWKDFTGTIKKIVWPSRAQVLKSSAVVLVSIIVVGLVIFGFDRGLTALFDQGAKLAGELGSQMATTEEVTDDAAGEETTEAAADEQTTEAAAEEETTEAAAEEETTEAAAEETSADAQD
jgi:preprotein translocase SecE subunit